MYASLLGISDALHLDVFDQPASQGFFSNLLKDLLSSPLFGPLAWELEPARIDPQIDEQLGQHDGAAIPLQDGDLPTDFPQALLKKGLQPENIRAPESNDFIRKLEKAVLQGHP